MTDLETRMRLTCFKAYDIAPNWAPTSTRISHIALGAALLKRLSVAGGHRI